MFDFPNSPTDGQIFSPGGGFQYQWSAAGSVWRQLGTSTPVTVQIVETVYSASGTYTKSAGLSYLEVEVQAPGGGGGGVPATVASQFAAGSGGSAGTYTRSLFSASAIPASVSVTIGAAGAGVSGANGSAGGTTSFGSLLSCNGGPGGLVGIVTTTMNYIGGPAGSTGTALGSVTRVGQRGSNAVGVLSGAFSLGGAGADSQYGTGGPYLLAGTAPGLTAFGYGSGGGGAITGPSQPATGGGNGGPGLVVVREYYFSIAAVQPSYVPTADTRNRIVNPAFTIDQEAIGTVSTSGTYYCDGWLLAASGTGAVNVNRQAGTAYPAYTQFIVATAGASTGTQSAGINNRIEGLNTTDLRWGTAFAIPAVLTFAFQANAAGTYNVSLRNAVPDTSWVGKIVVSAADVSLWKVYTFAIPAPTIGTWNTDNTIGINLNFLVSAGATIQTANAGIWQSGNFLATTDISNGMASTSNRFYWANVALYADPNNTGLAPPFQVPDYATELVRCQRYWQNQTGPSGGVNIIHGIATSASQAIYGHVTYPVAMRATPTIASVPSYGNCNTFTTSIVSNSGFRCSATTVAAGSAYVVFTWTASARM